MKKKIIISLIILITISALGSILIYITKDKKTIDKSLTKEEQLIQIAKEVEKENKITLIASSGNKHTTYTLKTLKEVYKKNINAFKNCNEENTYITIYHDKNNKQYEINLDCQK